MDIKDFQELIARTYLDKDESRGSWGTFAWLVEETGELSRAMRSGDRTSLREEFADVMAWLVSLANLYGIDLDEAVAKYAGGCPKCNDLPCTCAEGSPDRAT
ncbi:MAG: nucleotide pyrophosphohydrolase [Actinobacteria bacterium]|nr:MAG: nucleotide pyrophosphohydrolase [Actinomycetota bacterium]